MASPRNEAHKESPNHGTLWTELVTAVTFLTRVPVRAPRGSEGLRLVHAVWAFPLVGAALGAVGALVFAGASSVGLTLWLAAMLAVAAQLIVTGALHEDGLADVADGFGGGATPEQKLAIMRDSRSGIYGVCAIVLALMMRIGALAALADPAIAAAALVLAGVLSRGTIVGLLYWMPPARPDGLGASLGRPSAGVGLAAAALSIFCAALLSIHEPLLATLAVPCAAVAALAVGRLAWRQVGGYTGDVLGAAQQVAEVVVLLAAVIVLT